MDITILATSDVHGRFMPFEYASNSCNNLGSLTQIYTLVKKIRNETKNVILIDAGDAIQDNYVEIFKNYEKNPMIVAMNEMEYDIWTMGNHEFNFDQHILKKTIDKFKGTVLCGNVYKKDGTRCFTPYKIIEKENVRIGILGITTPMIVYFEKDSERLKDLIVKDALEETMKLIDEIHGKVDALIGIMHMGLENENNNPNTGVLDIVNQCPTLDVVIAGHMHQNISSMIVNKVLITEPYKYARSISKIDLKFEKNMSGYNLIDKKSQTIDIKNIMSDKELEKILNPFHTIILDIVNQPIGKLIKNNLVEEDEIKGIATVYVKATPLFNLFFETIKYYSKADVIALGADNEKAKLDVGDIRVKDIAYNYTYTGGEITVYEVTGEDLKNYMEWSAGYFNTLKDKDMTISYNIKRRALKYSTNDLFGGICYKIDLRKEEGSRIVDLKFENGASINLNTKLTLAMNSYRMEMLKKEYEPFKNKNFKVVYNSKEEFGQEQGTIRNLIIRYIKEVKNGVIEADMKKNWEIIGIDKNSKDYEIVKNLINKGLLKLPSKDNCTNIQSINIKDIEKYIKFK